MPWVLGRPLHRGRRGGSPMPRAARGGAGAAAARWCSELRGCRCRGLRCGVPRAVWDAGVPIVAADGTAVPKIWAVWCAGRPLAPRAALSVRTRLAPSGHGKICAPCMIRGARAAKRAPSRQDLRAVHSQTAVCGAFRMHNAHILPKPAHFGCMAAKCCHEPALFPSGAPSGTHEAKKLPWLTARERTTSKYCHGSPPENAPRRYLAKAGSPGTHRGDILPLPDAGGTHFASISPPASARERTAAISCHDRMPAERPAPRGSERPTPHGTERPAPTTERPTASAWLIVKHHAMCRSTITPCDARGAFSTAKKVSCRLRVSMWWNELPALA